MRKLKIPALGCLTIFVGVAAWFVIAGLLEPSLDPEFENNLAGADAQNQQQLIAAEAEKLGVTAISVTVIDGANEPQSIYAGRAHKDGVMQMASLSKAAAAATILIVAEQQEASLDEDIRGQVTSIDIAALEGGDRPITLRQLLSHTTGASQSGYPGYPRNGDIPTAAQVITSPPRFFEAQLTFDGEPGEFSYSGGGYVIAQIWAQDVTGKPFEVLAEELLLAPLGMTQSTFAQPLEETDLAPHRIVGADSGFDPLGGVFASFEDSWHIYPEQSAAGLWSTSRDYARFVTALLDAAGGAENAIPVETAQAMITPEAETDFAPGAHYGLGVMVEPDDESGLTDIWHTGANAGYRTIFIARPANDETARKVVVVAANTSSAAYLNRAIAEALIEQ